MAQLQESALQLLLVRMVAGLKSKFLIIYIIKANITKAWNFMFLVVLFILIKKYIILCYTILLVGLGNKTMWLEKTYLCILHINVESVGNGT